MFIGDELDSFLLSTEQLGALLPDVGEVGSPESEITIYSDGGGAPVDPQACAVLYAEQALGSLDGRAVNWQIEGGDGLGPGTLRAVSFGSVDLAADRMDQLLTAADQCESFVSGGQNSFADVAIVEQDDARAMAGVLEMPGIDWSAFYAYAQAGNVLVTLMHEFDGEASFDSAAVAEALAEQAGAALAELTDALTADPPVIADPPAVGSEVPVADWEITPGAAGPLRLGMTADEAIALVPGAVDVTPEGRADSRTLELPEDAGTIWLRLTDAGVVDRVTIGSEHVSQTATQHGDELPSASGVEVGSTFADATAAFPGGTTVRVVSSAELLYVVTDRAGRVITFHADADAEDAASATIFGISVRDASTEAPLTF